MTVAILLLLLPVACWTPWPYRLSPLAIIAGLVLERVPFARRVLRPVAAAGVAGGVILLAQSVVLTLYAAVTARSHDLPGVFVKLLAGLGWLAGIDAAADGPLLVVQSMRLPHRLAITWDMVVDPATLMFLVGGLAWITIEAGSPLIPTLSSRETGTRLRGPMGLDHGPLRAHRGCLAADPRDAAPGPVRASRRGERRGPAAARDEPVPLAVDAAGPARSSAPVGLAMGAVAER